MASPRETTTRSRSTNINTPTQESSKPVSRYRALWLRRLFRLRPFSKGSRKNWSTTRDQKTNSLSFFDLPPEIRLQVYEALFYNTRLRFSRPKPEGPVKPDPYALAILQVCRRINEEVKDTWLGQILFDFEHPILVLDKICSMPEHISKKIRHVRMTDQGLEMGSRGMFNAAQMLKLLPGLQLDTLTIVGTMNGWAWLYHTIQTLVQHGRGWKELRVIAQTPGFLAFTPKLLVHPNPPGRRFKLKRLRRVPQPGGWQQQLVERDGAETNPSVRIYRATVPKLPNAVLSDKSRTEFEQRLTTGVDLEEYGLHRDKFLRSEDEGLKSVLVVVKRGEGVDYRELSRPEYIPRLSGGDIRDISHFEEWEDIQMDVEYKSVCARHRAGQAYMDSHASGEKSVSRDEYSSVEDYSWDEGVYEFGRIGWLAGAPPN